MNSVSNRALSPGKTVHIVQGEHAISSDENVMMSTILGSCVAICLFDPVRKVGGMNHILLPGDSGSAARASSFGINAMELLINGLIKQGVSKQDLQAKAFGGARMIEGLSDVGKRNAEFALEFLAAESIPCLSKSFGGVAARRVQFWPASGRARQKVIDDRVELVEKAPEQPTSDIELF